MDEDTVSVTLRRRKKCCILLSLLLVVITFLVLFTVLELVIPVQSPLPTEAPNDTYAVKSYELAPHAQFHRRGYEQNSHLAMLHKVQQAINATNCWLCSRLPQAATRGMGTYAEPFPLNSSLLTLYHVLLSTNRKMAEGFEKGVLAPMGLLALTTIYARKGDNSGLWRNGPPLQTDIPYYKLIRFRWSLRTDWISQCQSSIYEENSCPTPIHTHTTRSPSFCISRKGSIPVGDTPHCIQTIPFQHDLLLFAGLSIYFVCGETAYTWLPRYWGGVCFLSLLLPDVLPVRTEDLHLLSVRPLSPEELVRSKRYSMKDFVKGIFPMYGITENSREISSLATLLENTINATTTALAAISVELRAVRLVALQNRQGLDLILMKTGGLCKTIGTSCCTYIPSSYETVADSIQRMHTIERLTRTVAAETGPDSSSPFSSWSSSVWYSWGWKIVLGFFGIIAVIVVFCLCLHCLPAVCSALSHATPDLHPDTVMIQLTPQTAHRTQLDTRAYVPGYGHLPSVLYEKPILEIRHLYKPRAKLPVLTRDGPVYDSSAECEVAYHLKLKMCARPE